MLRDTFRVRDALSRWIWRHFGRRYARFADANLKRAMKFGYVPVAKSRIMTNAGRRIVGVPRTDAPLRPIRRRTPQIALRRRLKETLDCELAPHAAQ